ncbi:MAG: hypothetical protein RDU41_08360 [Clostridia bacterium]|nr:hypothetical protein [Clostridia bacterium]
MNKQESGMVIAEINDYPVDKYNRLFPATLTQLSPLHKVMVNIVNINPDKDAGDVYPQNNGLALAKIGCLKLMTAANVIMEQSQPILPTACQRCMQIAKTTKTAPKCGSCESKTDVAYQVSILVPEPSGSHRRYIATKEMSRATYKGLPEHMAAQCESKALLRALRAGLGIKGTYTKAELLKPFAVALVVLNAADPELKRAMLERYARGQDALFGGGVRQLGPVDESPLMALGDGMTVEAGTGTVICDPDDDDEDGPPTLDFETDEAGLRMQETLIPCEGDDCGGVIEDTTDSKGNKKTAEDFAAWTKQQTGRRLCYGCFLRFVKANRKGA